MRRVISIFLSFFIMITTLQAQLAMGEWQAQMAYSSTSVSVYFNKRVYAVSKGSLYSYDPEDEDILTYDLVNLLSDVFITHIAYCPSQKTLMIVYDNGNIDLMDENENIYNITDYKNKSIANKEVNSIFIYNEYAYMTTGFGIVVVDIKKREINTTYTANKNVYSCTIHDGYIYAAIDKIGLYKGNLNDNLLDINNWEKVHASTFVYVASFNNELFGYINKDAFVKISPSSGDITRLLEDKTCTYFDIVNDKMLIKATGKLYSFTSSGQYETIKTDEDIVNVSYGSSIYWVSVNDKNLAGYKKNNTSDTFEMIVSPVTLNAPKRNLFYQAFFHNNKLFTCGGGILWDRFNYPGTIQVLNSDGIWNIFQDEGITEQTGKRIYYDIASLAVDPDDDNHVFAGSAGEGLYEFQDGEFVMLHTPDNSGIETPEQHKTIIRIDGLKYDKNKNLWMLNAGAKNIVKVYTKEKKWISIYNRDIEGLYTFRNTFFDRRGWMWCLTPTWVNSGIFVLNYNGTLEDTSDDKTVFINKIVNQDGVDITGFNMYCAVEDNEGTIWVGTNKGPFVINNPTRVFDTGSFYFTQIKVPRNDGTSYADYLLENIPIKVIAIDGANRKWIGTESNGIYLLSADGLEEIHHFTTENSPLLSDEIQTIAINDETGVVYIGTGKGLIAYQSNATKAEDSFLKSKVRAYPNPVKPDYEGYITITGLMADSNVKITDSYGSLIYEGTSIGGSFSWNGRNSKGKRVASGVYNVLAADSEGEEGIVTKIVMIK